MICNSCHGRHFVNLHGSMQPCQECGGLGELNCCEGLQEQPEPSPGNPVSSADSPTCPAESQLREATTKQTA